MAAIATSRFSIHKQSVPGTTPTNATWQNLAIQQPGVSGGPANTEVESQKLDHNRNAPGVKIVGEASSLTIPFEAQVPTADTQGWWELLKASIYAGAAQGTYANAANGTWNNASATLTINASDQAALFSSSVTVGDVIQIWSNAASSTKYYARVLAKNNSGSNTTSLTLDITNTGTSITDARFKKGTTIVNGTTQTSFAMLRSFISPSGSSYDRFCFHTRENVDSAQIAISARSLITGSFTTVGVGQADIGTTTSAVGIGASPTFVDPPTSDVLDGTNNIPFLRIAGADFAVQSFQVGWNNNSQTRSQVGTYAATGVSAGIFRGTGTVTAYFDDIVEFNKAINGTGSSAYFIAEDSADRALIISLPRIRYGNPTLPTQDRDVIANLPFQFEQGTDDTNSIRISFIN